MKKKWHIKTRLLVTMTGLTCLILVVVAIAFNLAVKGYIRARVSSQLDLVSRSATEIRREERGPRMNPDPFNEHPDKITGTRGNAVILDEKGNLEFNLHGDNKIAAELAEWYQGLNQAGDISNKTAALSSGTFAVSTIDDPAESGRTILVYVDVTSIMAFAKRINLVLLIVIAVAVLLSVVLSGALAKTLAEPVQRLSDFASEIGRGNLSPKELAFRDREFDELGNTMNRMAAELREAKQKQETFFQNVSHELRTPLTSIRGNAEGIVYGVMEPKSAGAVILSESDKLAGMVEDILYLSRMGKGRPEGALEQIDLRDVLSLCVSEQRAEAEKRNLTFSFDFDDEPVLAAIREQDAERLCGNLISNAVRYAKREIRLFCRKQDGGITIRVSDDGAGIAEEDLPYVFERFYKGNDGQHGIGLAIAKSVTESYHGKIHAYNENGAVFEAAFPQ